MSKKVRRFRRSVVGQYLQRNHRLKAMGFQSYQEFLHSNLWRNTKAKARLAGLTSCAICGSPNNVQYHHNQYEMPHKPNLRDIIPLCGWCHGKVHEIAHSPNHKYRGTMRQAVKRHRRYVQESPALMALLAD